MKTLRSSLPIPWIALAGLAFAACSPVQSITSSSGDNGSSSTGSSEGNSLDSSGSSSSAGSSRSSSGGTGGSSTTVAGQSSRSGGTTGGGASTGGASSGGVGSGGMIVGLNAAGWGVAGAQDVASSFPIVRYDNGSSDASDYIGAGLKLDVVFAGDYDTNGVADMINNSGGPGAWAQSTLSWYEAACPSVASCPYVEVLNEPYGSWYWGINSEDQTNATAFASLIQATWTAFHNKYGSGSPQVIADVWDTTDSCPSGGSSCTSPWWSGISSGLPSINDYYDAVVVHPYPEGCGSNANLANLTDIEQAHAATGKPVFVSEVGWVTNTPTGSCLANLTYYWSEADQCSNIYSFVTWAASQGYVEGITLFNYADYDADSGGNWWGVVRFGEGGSPMNGSHKPSWAGLAAAAAGKANPCP
jgi:hypothetical protein